MGRPIDQQLIGLTVLSAPGGGGGGGYSDLVPTGVCR